jgi:hypothetical protein
MAQIPLGNFGYASPEVRSSPAISTRVQDDSAGVVARTISKAASSFSAEFRAAAEMQRDIEARKKKANAATKLMEYETQLQTAEQELERGYSEGTVKSDTLLGARDEAEKKIRESIAGVADDLDEESKAQFYAEMDARNINRKESFQNLALNASKKDYQSTLLESADAFRRANLGNAVAAEAYVNGEFGAELDRAFGPDAAKYKREFIQQANMDSINLAISKAGDDSVALSGVLSQLSSKESQSRLDPDYLIKQRASLQSQINNLNERAIYRAEREQEKRERKAEVVSKRFETHIADGGIATPEMIKEVSEATKGTVYETSANEYAKRQDEIQGLLKAPEDAQRAWLADTRARMNQSGSTPEEKKFVDSMETEINRRASLRKENPLEAGEIELGANPTQVDWSNPDPESVADRIASREVVAKKQGKDPGILKKQEVDAIVEKLDTAAPDQVIAELKGLSSALGDDRELYNSAMQQLDKKSTTYALAGKWATGGREKDAITLIEGRKVIDEKQTTLPSIDKFRQAIMSQYGDALRNNPAAANAAVENAYAVYASLVSKDGVTISEISQKHKAEAMKLAIGEQVKLGYGAGKVIVPHGRKPVEHKDAVMRGYAAAAAEYGGKVEANDLQFVPRSGGKYQLFDGREPLLDAMGKPIMVNPVYD